MRAKLAIALLIALVFPGPVLSPGQPLASPKPPATPLIAPEKQGEMQEIRLTEIQEGEKKWVLTAASADYLKDRDRIFINKVWAEVFGKNNDNIIITGDTGFIGIKSRDLTLEGNVQAKTAEYEFNSNLVHYDPQTRILSAPGPVQVKGPRLYVEGQGLTIDLKNNKLALAQHTVTKLRLAGGLWNF